MPETKLGQFGPELRRRRIAAGVSLTRFAELLSYSKGHLSKIERGHKVPPPGFARRCDAELDAGGELERLLHVDPWRCGGDGDPSDAGGSSAPSRTARVSGARELDGVARRRLLTVGATSLVAASMPAPVAGAAQVDGSSTVEIFRSQFDQMRRLGQTSDPRTLIPLLAAQTRALCELARQTDSGERVRLLALAARYAEYGGWMAQESGDDPAALQWTARAVDLAEAGGDRDLASYALVRRALITFYAGDSTETVQLVGAAQGSGLPPRIRGLAAQREAQGHALAGDRDACLRALDRAGDLLRQARAEGDGAPVLGTTSVSDPAAMVTGWCLYDLGRPGPAAEVLDHECPRIPVGAVRSRARYGLRRALAHVAAGEPEHGSGIAAELLPLVPALRSATIRADVRRLARELNRFRSSGPVLELQSLLAKALHP